MKSISIILIIILTYQLGLAQIERPTEILTTKDLNLKGAVKMVTDSTNILTKEGKVDKDALSVKTVYFFNEAGFISRTATYANRKGKQHLISRQKYDYNGNKLISKTIEDKEGKKSYTYTHTREGYYFTEDGTRDTIKIFLSNGKVVSKELIYYIKSSYTSATKDKRMSDKTIYKYNETGQISTVFDESLTFATEAFEYDTNGDVVASRWPRGNKQDTYKYSNYVENNWTKCLASVATFDVLMVMTMTDIQIIRSITYHTVSENSNNTPSTKNGVAIEIDIKNYNENTLYVAYTFGSKTYIQDTIEKVNGKFKYTSNEEVKDAIYKIVLKPNSDYFNIIIDKKNRFFKVQTDVTDLVGNMNFIGSEENTILYENLKFIEAKIKESKSKNSDISKIKQEISAFQNKLINENPTTYLSFYLNSNKEIEVPDFSNIESEDGRKAARFYYYRQNYFNNIDFSDNRLLRTDYFEEKILNYLDKLTVASTDSIKVAVDFILKSASKNKEIYQFLASTLLNKYASSKFICMDAVYVHIAEKYYCNTYGGKKADWVDAEKLDKICKSANKLKPLLCGAKAPDIKLKVLPSSTSTTTKISDIKAKYKIIVFWSLSELKEPNLFSNLAQIYPKLKLKNAEIITVATSNNSVTKVEEYCSKYNPKWTNTIEVNSQISNTYNLINPVSIFILDSDNKILYKQISVDQIEGVLSN